MRFHSVSFLVFVLLLCVCVSAQTNLRSELLEAKQAGDFSGIEPRIIQNAIAAPTDPDRIELLGLLRFFQGRFRESSSLFKRTLSFDSGRQNTRILLVDSLRRQGLISEATGLLDEIDVDKLSEDTEKLDYARVAVELNRCESAEGSVSKITLAKLSAQVQMLRVRCALIAGDLKEVDRLLTKTEFSESNAVEISRFLFGKQEYARALSLLKSVKPLQKHGEEFLSLLTLSNLLLDDSKGAEAPARALTSSYPKSNSLNLIKGIFALNADNPGEAIEPLKKYLIDVPDSILGHEELILASIRANQPSEGFSAAENLVRLTPERPASIYLLGAVALQSNKLSEAEAVLKRLLAISPTHSRGCLALGLVYAANENRFDDARKQMQSCIEIDPRNYEAYYQIGLSHKTQGENEEAIRFIRKAVEINPEYASAQRDLGVLYMQTEQNDIALRHLKAAAKLNERDADVHFQLSRLYNLLGERELAKGHFEKFRALRKDPEGGM